LKASNLRRGTNGLLKAAYVVKLTLQNNWLSHAATVGLSRGLSSCVDVISITFVKTLTSSSTWILAAGCLTVGVAWDIIRYYRTDSLEKKNQIKQSIARQLISFVPMVTGQIVGSTIGAAIGTLILPGIGTFIGNLVGGLLGGYYAGKWT
jgi:hypothetical protein